MPTLTFEQRVASSLNKMSPAEQRVAEAFLQNREEVLFASAASLAEKAKTSDATVVRATKTLGFSGMDDLRQTLAAELKRAVSLSDRLNETLREVGNDLDAAFRLTLDIHSQSVETIRRDISGNTFARVVKLLGSARRIALFGIGPSSALADYFAIQLNRFGLDAMCLSRTGLLFADDLRQLRSGDVLFGMAYSHVYRELAVLLDEADRKAIKKILVTDILPGAIHDRLDIVLPVARGRTNMLSMHTATLALIETLLVGIAAKHSAKTLQSLEALNVLREQLVERPMDLVTGSRQQLAGSTTKVGRKRGARKTLARR